MSTPLEIITKNMGDKSIAERLLAALRDEGFVCVPLEPSAAMIKEAWAYALDEDAKFTWKSMIETYFREQEGGNQAL